jgi:uncharacterized membrane protein
MIREQTFSLICFYVSFILIFFSIQDKLEIANSKVIIGFLLFILGIILITFHVIKRKRVLKSINLNSNTIIETTDILTSYKKSFRKIQNQIGGFFYFVGFSMMIWDNIKTDTPNGRYLFFVIVIIMVLVIVLIAKLIEKLKGADKPIDRLIEELLFFKDAN